MVDELNKDYIKLARIKGMSSKNIMVKHVLKNAFVPLVQYIPASFLLTISGSLLVERFFSVPGMGPLLTDAITRYDLNVVQTLVIIYAALGIIGVFLGDILMMTLDPRIKLTDKGRQPLMNNDTQKDKFRFVEYSADAAERIGYSDYPTGSLFSELFQEEIRRCYGGCLLCTGNLFLYCAEHWKV